MIPRRFVNGDEGLRSIICKHEQKRSLKCRKRTSLFLRQVIPPTTDCNRLYSIGISVGPKTSKSFEGEGGLLVDHANEWAEPLEILFMFFSETNAVWIWKTKFIL